MKVSVLTAAAAVAGIAFALPQADTFGGVNKAIEAREGGAEGADGIISLIMLAEELIANNHNAWDADIEHGCNLVFTTSDGTNCTVTIACFGVKGSKETEDVNLEPGPGTGLDTWSACYLNGRQFFNHAKVGDFSITFTQAGGVNSDQDGLHSPNLQVAQIDNWAVIDVDGEQKKTDDGQQSGVLCKLDHIDRGYQWTCGVPEVGYSTFGLTNTPPIQNGSYASGQCGIHWIQYQIPEGDSQYYLAARIVDAKGALLAQVGNSYIAGSDATDDDRVDATNPVNIDSALPYVTIITVAQPGSASDVDDLPVNFAYSDQTFDSSSAQCSTGSYDSGSRQGDCSFTC